MLDENTEEQSSDMVGEGAPADGDAPESDGEIFEPTPRGDLPQDEAPTVENGGSAPVLKLWAKCGSRMLQRAEVACPSPEVAAGLAEQIFKQIAAALQQMADQQRFMRENVIIPVKAITPEMKAQLDAFQANQRNLKNTERAAKSGIVIASH